MEELCTVLNVYMIKSDGVKDTCGTFLWMGERIRCRRETLHDIQCKLQAATLYACDERAGTASNGQDTARNDTLCASALTDGQRSDEGRERDASARFQFSIATRDRLWDYVGGYAMVTGGEADDILQGGTGLGLIIAKTLEHNGAKVYITGRRQEKLDEAVKQAAHGNIIPIAGSTTSREDLQRAVDIITKETGHIDLLINNAGQTTFLAGPGVRPMPTGDVPLSEYRDYFFNYRDSQDWLNTLNTNISGVFITSMAFLELLDAGNKRRAKELPTSQIITIGSVGGLTRQTESFIYNASKAGVHHLMMNLGSYFVKYDIRTNVIAPGWFPSDMSMSVQKMFEKDNGVMPRTLVPRQRMGLEEELAGTVLHLASPAGGYCNGNISVIDGGFLQNHAECTLASALRRRNSHSVYDYAVGHWLSAAQAGAGREAERILLDRVTDCCQVFFLAPRTFSAGGGWGQPANKALPRLPGTATSSKSKFHGTAMDPDASSRKRKHRLQLAARTTARTAREKKSQQEHVLQRPQASKLGRIKSGKDDDGIAGKLSGEDGRPTSPPGQDDVNARLFTIGNVGANGTLYLQPTRAPARFAQRPTTPPDTADGKKRTPTEWYNTRYSTQSGAYTPRLLASGPTIDHGIPLPPLSLANGEIRRRTRSHSVSTTSAMPGTASIDPFALRSSAHDRASTRSKSFTGIRSSSLLDMNIPNHRLGTPHFGDRGSAHLYRSAYSSVMSDQPSSFLSAHDFDKMFPHPPGKATVETFLHPSRARSARKPTRSPVSALPLPSIGAASFTDFDEIEANVNSPALVRYDITTGRILAATAARLIAQITSPVFLDYELLSDFFLTYRCFMSDHDVMSSLLARLEWALNTTNDAGQIVRVRTFVALRHWMLNYFTDDFAHSLALRQQFCDRVNHLSRTLQNNPDRSGKVTDMNIIEELKKCWRRTCAMYWSSPNTSKLEAHAEIVPGGVLSSPKSRATTLGRTSDVQRLTKDSVEAFRYSNMRFSSRRNTIQSFEADFAAMTGKQASIPASPMSEESLDILSCSVPFLRHVQQTSVAGRNAPRPIASHRNKTQNDAPSRPRHQHKRSGSFSDALRGVRQSSPPPEHNSIDFRSSPAIALTGGLVRGLLLQPSPAKVEVLMPLSPPLEDHNSQDAAVHESYFQDQHLPQNKAVKKIVGEVRRALSARRHRHDSPARGHRATHSSSSRSTGPMTIHTEKPMAATAQALRGLLGRMDMLGARASESYQNVFGHLVQPDDIPRTRSIMDNVIEADEHGFELKQDRLTSLVERSDHRLTAGSRSIVIGVDPDIDVDAITMSRDLQSVRSMSSTMTPDPLRFRKPHSAPFDRLSFAKFDSRIAPSDGSLGARSTLWPRAASDSLLSEKLSMPPPWREEHLSPEDLHHQYFPKSVLPSDSPPVLGIDPASHQLRRRPGGDLKAAEHIHDLELLPRPHTSGHSYSAFSHSRTPSAQNFPGTSRTYSSTYGGLHSWKAQFPRAKSTSLQLLETYSLQANLRPSYQAQFAHLRRLTPGLDGGGGIEDALLKLEGKVDTPKSSSFDFNEAHPGLKQRPHDSVDTSRGIKSEYGPSIAPSQEAHQSTNLATESFSLENFLPLDLNLTPTTDVQGASIFDGSRSSAAISDVTGIRQVRSSLPSMSLGSPAVPRVLLPTDSPASRADSHSLHESFLLPMGDLGWTIGNVEDNSDPLKSLRRRSGRPPRSASTLHSFLLDDNESLSDISTEIGGPTEDDDYGVHTFYFDDTVRENDELAHRPYRPPPTPPTSAPPGSHSSDEFARQAMTPSSESRFEEVPDTISTAGETGRCKGANPHSSIPMQALTSHMPFILAFESEVIAEQFSIIEKDALDEVDWKDLIGLRWVQAPPAIRNWADYLKKQDEYNGIDIAITRFNLVVKWVISECLLTDSPGERARCITKYIHIATHCRRFRNFASCYQITVALLSSVLSSLHKTWALVPPAEKAMLEQLELLCQPVRNFHNLRAEMETSSMERGCIPFIGLYTHDLKINAQKQARFDAHPPGQEVLINFERYQTAASIVKSLLRLIEASSKYIFRPHPEALSRCLWLAALEDSEISARSKVLEQYSNAA
nr:guanine nucleotide exchange factor lte1 [Quercus suber]